MKHQHTLIDYSLEFQTAKSVSELSTDALTLFGFLALIVDIRYRNRYGQQVVGNLKASYIEGMQTHSLLPDHTFPVDSALEGNESTVDA